MSPEQALARRVVIDGRTDVYSLGVTLYELLTLRPAFDGQDRAEILRRIAEEEPTPLRKLNPAVPPRPGDDRPEGDGQGAGRRGTRRPRELADDLRRFLEDRPIAARRVGPAERLARWGARNPWVAGLGAVILVLTAAIAVVTSAMAIRLKERADEVRGEAVRANRALGTANEANSGAPAMLKSGSMRTLYAARMGLAQAAWDGNNVGRMLDLLEPSDPDPGEAGLRRVRVELPLASLPLRPRDRVPQRLPTRRFSEPGPRRHEGRGGREGRRAAPSAWCGIRRAVRCGSTSAARRPDPISSSSRTGRSSAGTAGGSPRR